ncbi:DoxX family membrane protein [Dactylosporangium roseum]|uniref:DoxX family membrane protein n=1 Tax=Dactylosporangium roseum TaxID=47989 RepID=A0ABY5ZFE2_9ACTN|nr:DoxX family membrane protein [Dactylosporangium roseum]UWZ39673.1 DoxX family membrane protein [Dactylosporangium roseum]
MVNIAKDHSTAVKGAIGTPANPIVPDLAPDSTGYRPVDHTSVVTTAGDRRSSAPASTARRSASPAAARYLLAGIRLALGWIFLWAFLDKLFGFGFATPSARAWLNGGSPTNGFLSSAKGPFSDFYHAIAGTTGADVLFMGALLAIGVALMLGVGMWLAAAGGALLTVMMWTAVLPPAGNPFMDEHLVYAAVLVVLALLGAGNTFGAGRAWAALPLVRRAPWLR